MGDVDMIKIVSREPRTFRIAILPAESVHTPRQDLGAWAMVTQI
jgi:hypothetical protein